MSRAVMLAEYSPEWPQRFAAEADVLRQAFAPVPVVVEHIGSTAVPGMSAKPILDVLVGAPSLDAIEGRIDALRALGYRYVPEHERVIPDRRYFSRSDTVLGVHVHAVVEGGRLWTSHLAFRDALRRDARLFNNYLALKRRLAVEHVADRGAYTDAKGPFISRTLAALASAPPVPRAGDAR